MSFEQPDLPGFEMPSVQPVEQVKSAEELPLLEYTFNVQGASSNEKPIFTIKAEDSSLAYAAYVTDCKNRNKMPLARHELSISGVIPGKKK